MAQAAAKAMQQRGGGVIVQTGSLWALQAIGATPSAAYSAANAGVHALTRNLAIELAASNIRINTVPPPWWKRRSTARSWTTIRSRPYCRPLMPSTRLAAMVNRRTLPR